MHTFHKDMEEEARIRAGYPEDERRIANELIDKMSSLCEGHRPDIVMNVVTSLLIGLYLTLHKNPTLDHLLDRVAHNYCMQTRPDEAKPQ